MFLASVGIDRRSRQRRPPDAVTLGPSPLQHAVEEQLRRHAVSARGRLRRGRADLRARHGDRGPRDALSPATRSPTSRSAKAARAKASSGNRSTRRVSASCRSSISSKTTATRSRFPSTCRQPAATSRASSKASPACACSAATAPTSSPAIARCARRWRTRGSGKGPALVHATVTRPYSHSFSDDERLYKTPGEREAEARRDPLRRMRQFLKTEGLATDRGPGGHRSRRVDREVNDGRGRGAAGAPSPIQPPPPTSSSHPTSTPRRDAFSTEPAAAGQARHDGRGHQRTLKDEMARNPRIVIFGQDVADASNSEALVAGRRQGRRVQGDARPAAPVRQRRASSTLRSPRPTSSGARSAWRCAG